ncbi:hypothetical protein R1sor_002159 [Riccia sorocarpa]|uniref:SAP domain-containing protein n=1 Tax=Riccia sorocarpa TaxID=122646 RepID=A0ABD3GY02_9MARC
MTRPPRPKYPSDAKDYHEIRRPGCAHTIRLPEDLLPTYVNLKRCLGPRTSHADVIRFLFEASEAAIQGVVQSNEFRVVVDSQDDGIEDDAEELDPDVGDVAEDSGESDPETISEAGIIQGSSSNVMAADSQVPPDTPAAARVYADAENAVWSRNKHKDKLQDQLQRTGRPLVVYVDCRFDSSRSGYHGTLPVINVADDKVIEMVTLTRKETGSSWRIESAALEKALTLLEERGLNISEVIHDDCAQVDSMLAARSIVSQKDLWHKCKNLMSKFKELLQEKRRTPTDSTVEAATTIAQVAVFSVQQLRDYCRQQSLLQTGSKLLLVQRVSVHLNLPEAGGTTEIQRTRPLRYPELASHDKAYKLKSWIYTCAKNAALRGDTTPELLTRDIHNAADHWAGDHATCRTLPGTRKCVVENWSGIQERKYPQDGETHKAVKDFMKKYITESKMKFYLRARENYISETFHSVINKFATKLRRRARTNRVLVDRTSQWKMQLAARVFT